MWWSRSVSNHVHVKGAEDVCRSYVIVVVIVVQVASKVPTNAPLRYWSNKQL